MNIERKIVGFELKATSGDGSTGTGIASCFHNIDSYGEIVAPGFFTADLPRFLSDGFVGGMNHDWDNPIGRPTEAKETGIGLEVGWKISETAHGRDCMTLLKDGVVKRLSIGFRTTGYERLETSDDVKAYWAKHGYTPSADDLARASDGGVRLLTRGMLYEFSPVVVPANDKAVVTGVKRGWEGAAVEVATERDFERLLRDAGFSRAQAVAITAAGYKAGHSQRDADAPGANIDDVTADPAFTAAMAAYFERETRLTALGV